MTLKNFQWKVLPNFGQHIAHSRKVCWLSKALQNPQFDYRARFYNLHVLLHVERLNAYTEMSIEQF